MTSNKIGQTILELILIMALLTILLPVLFWGFSSSISGKTQQYLRLQATSLLKEAEEAVRSVRKSGWNNIPADGNYYAQPTGTSWSLTPVSSPGANINGLYELINITTAYRNNGVLVTSSTPGALPDPSTKKIIITISWNTPFSSSINSTLYLTRQENYSQLYTTKTDFSLLGSINSNTIVADTLGTPTVGDAQIDLGAGGGGGDWCNPNKSITAIDLPKSGVANAISAIEGTVFAGTGDNASGVSFAKVKLSTDQDPPSANTEATFDGYKTNSVFGETGFAYLTTDTSHSQVVILDLGQYSDPPTNLKYLKVGSIDLGTGSIKGQNIFVKNNKAYVTTNNKKLFIYDITNRSSPILQNNEGLNLDGIGKKILVTGNYAYISTDSTTYQLEIVDVANTSNPSIVGRLNLGTNQSGVDVFVNTSNQSPTRAYLVTSTATSQKNFYIVNISNPSSPKLTNDSGVELGKFDTSGMSPTGVTVVTGNKAIIVGTGGTNQYQVIRIDDETANPVFCGGLQYATGVYGVASVLQNNGYAYSYIITGDASAELKIILGGGGGQYASNGTYTSAIFDTGYSTAFNRFSININQPPQTNVTVQISVADQVNNSCEEAVYTYVGPDTVNPTGSFFTSTNGKISGIIPILNISSYKNPGRCFRYRVNMISTDNTKSPSLYDFILNYSP